MNHREKSFVASGYSPEQTELVRRLCLTVAVRLSDMMDDLVVVGGLVPSLIIDPEKIASGHDAHVGTMDLDIGLQLALFDGQRYEALTQRLRGSGFAPDAGRAGQAIHQRWRLSSNPHVSVDFLIPPAGEEDKGGRLKHIEADFAAIITPGLELAFHDRLRIPLHGWTIAGEEAVRDIWVCGPGAFTVLKALAFDGRGENKDAYDLYYVLRHFGSDVHDVAQRLLPLATTPEAQRAISILKRDFLSHDGLGPRRIAEFIEGAPDDDIQADVVGFVRELCRKLGF
jgi:hypothetical protein